MAFANWDRITTTTRDTILPKVVDNIFDYDPLLMRLLTKAESKKGGNKIVVPVIYAKNTAGGSYAGLDTLATNQVPTRSAAEFEWKQVYQSVVLSGIAQAKNQGTEKIIDLVGQEMKEAELGIKDKMCTQLYSDGTGNESKDITGIHAVCDDRTNVDTYGDLSRTTYSWWRAQYSAAVGSITLDNLLAFYDSCSSGSDSPTVIVTTELLWRALEALQTPFRTYSSPTEGYPKMTREGIGPTGKTVGANAGFNVLYLRGTPVVSSEYATSGQVFFLNEKYLQFYTLKQVGRKSKENGFAMTDMKEPVDQDGEVAQILWYGNLTCNECRRQGRMVGCTA